MKKKHYNPDKIGCWKLLFTPTWNPLYIIQWFGESHFFCYNA